jgi:hypothetical protein
VTDVTGHPISPVCPRARDGDKGLCCHMCHRPDKERKAQ